jgi:hypothetical protein
MSASKILPFIGGEHMGHIAIRLSPEKMNNPDLDIRYKLPDLVNEHTAGRVRDNGYDYASDSDNTLIVYLSCASPVADVQEVLRILGHYEVCGNRVLDSAVIGIAEDSREFTIVHPTSGGKFTVRDW